jgi:hypothetical protein
MTVVRNFEGDSQRSGFDRQTALQVMARNPERLMRDLGTRMEENIARLDRLQAQQVVFKDGVSLGSLATFAFSYDKPLFDKTWEAYVPALPLSFVSILLLIIGWSGSYAALTAGAAVLRSTATADALR